jgi:hypothetical protein
MHAEFLGQRHAALAAVQPVNRHLPKRLWIPSHSSLGHLHPSSVPSVPMLSVSIQGVSPGDVLPEN